MYYIVDINDCYKFEKHPVKYYIASYIAIVYGWI